MDYQANKIVLGFDIQPRTIRLIPKLSLSALRHGRDKELSMWYCLRAINCWGSGFLDQEFAVNSLKKDFHYSFSTAYRILNKGAGTFWEKQPNKFNRVQIKICGLQKVAEYLGAFCGQYFVEISPEEFSGKRGHRVRQQRAYLYSVFHKPESVKSSPISRASIAEATGICRRSQQRYTKIALESQPHRADKIDSNGKLVPVLDTVEGKARTWLIQKRLGNSYYNRGHRSARGMLRKTNAALKQSFTRGEACCKRRFFHTARSFIKCPNRHTDPYLLVRPMDQLLKTGVEWCQV